MICKNKVLSIIERKESTDKILRYIVDKDLFKKSFGMISINDISIGDIIIDNPFSKYIGFDLVAYISIDENMWFDVKCCGETKMRKYYPETSLIGIY